MRNLVFPLLLILMLSAASCLKSTNYRLDSVGPVQKKVVDLSGDWEKDYDRSDDFENTFQIYVARIQRKIKEIEQKQNRDEAYNAANGLTVSRESVLGLAKFTEEITRMPVLHIQQDKTGVKIKREHDFDLTCKFFGKQFTSVKNPYGTEDCIWNRGQLFIRINLDNGLKIVHQITLAPDAKELNITTTVASKEATPPLTVSNYYDRYTEPTSDYKCVHTLTKNDVCTKAK